MTTEAFTCQMCGHCCHGEGGIVMTSKDQIRLASLLNISVEKLISRYTERRGGKLHLITQENGYCFFFKDGCGVHSGRPDICRAWPYFRGNLVDKMSWKMVQDYCPGINPKAGHREFVRQGKQYLLDEDLERHNPESSPNALISDD